MKQNYALVFLKGLWIGGTLSIPGVSGGSMAMILGVYEQLIVSFNTLFRPHANKKESILFLVCFVLGALLGVMLFASGVLWLMQRYPTPMIFFFCGCVGGGVPLIFAKAGGFQNSQPIQTFKDRLYDGLIFFCWIAVGLCIMYLIALIPSGLFHSSAAFSLQSFLLQILGGLLTAAALVLPGISVSHMLYILGLYEQIMAGIAAFDVLGLFPFVLGVLGGVVLTSRMMETLLRRYKRQTYLIVLGFVLGSVVELFSGVNLTFVSPLCFFLSLCGFCLVYGLFRFGNRDAC